ncbi:MAG: hypothetical protein QM762_12805 [Chryseolinea sp.]
MKDHHFYNDPEFWKWFIKLLFLIVIAIPRIHDAWSEEAREMRRDMKGSNGKWDWKEIWEAHSLSTAKGSWLALMFMLVLTSMGQEFAVGIWLLFAGGVAGSTSYAAYLINLKEKHGK